MKNKLLRIPVIFMMSLGLCSCIMLKKNVHAPYPKHVKLIEKEILSGNTSFEINVCQVGHDNFHGMLLEFTHTAENGANGLSNAIFTTISKSDFDFIDYVARQCTDPYYADDEYTPPICPKYEYVLSHIGNGRTNNFSGKTEFGFSELVKHNQEDSRYLLNSDSEEKLSWIFAYLFSEILSSFGNDPEYGGFSGQSFEQFEFYRFGKNPIRSWNKKGIVSKPPNYDFEYPDTEVETCADNFVFYSTLHAGIDSITKVFSYEYIHKDTPWILILIKSKSMSRKFSMWKHEDGFAVGRIDFIQTTNFMNSPVPDPWNEKIKWFWNLIPVQPEDYKILTYFWLFDGKEFDELILGFFDEPSEFPIIDKSFNQIFYDEPSRAHISVTTDNVYGLDMLNPAQNTYGIKNIPAQIKKILSIVTIPDYYWMFPKIDNDFTLPKNAFASYWECFEGDKMLQTRNLYVAPEFYGESQEEHPEKNNRNNQGQSLK